MTPLRHSLPPTMKPDLLGGHVRAFRKDTLGFLTRLSSLGDVTTFVLGWRRIFLISAPEMLRDLLVTSQDKFRKGIGIQRLGLFLGQGLLTSEDAVHSRQRRMIQPAFHPARIQQYATAMIASAVRMESAWRNGETRDIDQEMMRLTLSVVCKTLFNADIESDADRVGRAMRTLDGVFDFLLLPCSELLLRLPVPPMLGFRRAQRELDEILYRMIARRRGSNADDGDLLSMLLLAQDEQDGGGMSDKQLRDECMTLLLAGHETTATALTWTFYLLSQNPDAEAAFHAELDEVLGDGPLRAEHYGRLRFTGDVLAESLRLFPPAWVIGRTAVSAHEFGGYRIPENSWVIASQYVLHRDARWWDRAGDFLPDRWRVQSTKDAGQRCTYFPFSRGVRNCIGEGFAWMECVLMLAAVGRKWRLRPDPAQKIGIAPRITLRPKHGMRMQVVQRQDRHAH